MTTVEQETKSVIEIAHVGWAAQADLDERRAVQSFRTQLFQKLKIPKDEVTVEPTFFDDHFDPFRAVGCLVDGVDFGLDKTRALAAVVWRCEEKGCQSRHLEPVRDLISLGRALAYGEHLQLDSPKCERHTKS